MSIGSFGTNLTPIASGLSAAAGAARMGATTDLTITGGSGVTPSFMADAISNGSVGLLGSGLTFTRASGATQRDFAGVMNPVLANELRFDGYRRVQNLYTATATLGTQSNTVTAQSYTVSFYGTGTVTFTGAATGSLVGQGAGIRVAITITCTAGTLTSTITGSCTQGQLETGGLPSEYVSVGTLASPYYGAFVDGVQYFSYQNGNTVVSNVVVPASGAAINPTTTLKGILREEARTNYFLNSTAPVTQTISLGVGTYTCYIYGSGSMTSSAGTATATGYGAATNTGTDWYTSNTFTTLVVTVAGTVVFTCAGSVTFAQVEGGGSGTAVALATSPIITAGATATRALDVLQLPVASIPSYGTSGAWQIEMIPRTGSNESGNSGGWLTTDTNTDATLYQQVASNVGATYNGTTGVTTSNAMTLLAVNKLATTYSPGATSVVLNAGAAGNDAVTAQQASVYMNLAPNSTTALHVNNTNAWLRKVRYFPTALTAAQLQTVTGAGY
jgi:hypothetical protein